jgi:hypothetical protein
MKKVLIAALAACAAAAVVTLPAAAVTPTVVYDNIPTPQPGNVPSVGFEANFASEFGGLVQLAGTQRQNPTVTVLMSSWGCQSGAWYSNNCVTAPGATFTHPITLNVRNVGPGDSPGSLIATSTQTFTLPYRPSASPSCTGGRWSDGTTCFNGLAAPISFTLTGVTLPSKVIVSVAYNTSHAGYAPLGNLPCTASSGGCPYDSLNVGTAGGPTTGSTPRPDGTYANYQYGGTYCDGGAGGSGTFRLDETPGCWTGFQPAFRIAALTINVPANANACKNNGWQTLTRADGSTFKNQGDCIQYVNTGK